MTGTAQHSLGGRLVRGYVRRVDRINRRIGRVAMYLIFVLIGILLWSSISKTLLAPSPWTLEMAQFTMVAYYIIGGPYSLQLGANVRMDLFYGSWSHRTKAWVDAFTVFFLLYFLVILFLGGIESMAYSLGYFGSEPFVFFADLLGALLTGGFDAAHEQLGYMERSPTAWRPYLWPIKGVMILGICMMILQASAEFVRDICRIRGEEI
ncbi:MAG: TRAP transporter small permease subunit [Sediminimonas qiaohouensis]|uniref:TRAP transporter small permease protein n=1 Tax=Sediminimonas qiaohouensis TaxID=552061 RepID=A0A7C9HIN8_9RHOB|nr:TRAP transporter small permease subunit [Sediminimonas qiaohouensis]MTJ04372.1 TRAP transporter small permease subunit [Sediminimonas qiaohouensis]